MTSAPKERQVKEVPKKETYLLGLMRGDNIFLVKDIWLQLRTLRLSECRDVNGFVKAEVLGHFLVMVNLMMSVEVDKNQAERCSVCVWGGGGGVAYKNTYKNIIGF